MSHLTAAEVQALAALAASRPMTSAELARSVSDGGMHIAEDDAAAILARLARQGLAERTPAASLGKYRISRAGRGWLADRTAG